MKLFPSFLKGLRQENVQVVTSNTFGRCYLSLVTSSQIGTLLSNVSKLRWNTNALVSKMTNRKQTSWSN